MRSAQRNPRRCGVSVLQRRLEDARRFENACINVWACMRLMQVVFLEAGLFPGDVSMFQEKLCDIVEEHMLLVKQFVALLEIEVLGCHHTKEKKRSEAALSKKYQKIDKRMTGLVSSFLRFTIQTISLLNLRNETNVVSKTIRLAQSLSLAQSEEDRSQQQQQ